VLHFRYVEEDAAFEDPEVACIGRPLIKTYVHPYPWVHVFPFLLYKCSCSRCIVSLSYFVCVILYSLQDALPDGEGEGDQPEDNVEILEGQEAVVSADRPRITTRYMTKYEKARVLGTRALQIRWLVIPCSIIM
jgi:hypothetical protein